MALPHHLELQGIGSLIRPAPFVPSTVSTKSKKSWSIGTGPVFRRCATGIQA